MERYSYKLRTLLFSFWYLLYTHYKLLKYLYISMEDKEEINDLEGLEIIESETINQNELIEEKIKLYLIKIHR